MNAEISRRKAFTLIELLIVITIIGILAVALVPRIIAGPSKARDAQRMGDLKQISSALESLYADYGSYPYYNGCVSSNMNADLSNYMSTVPTDPSVSVTAGTNSLGEINRGSCTTGYGYIGLQGGGAAPTSYGTYGAKGYILTTDIETETLRLDGVYDVSGGAFSVNVSSNAATNFSGNSGKLCNTSSCTGGNVIYLLGH